MHKFGDLFPQTSDGAIVVTMEETIYPKEAILKACYLFTDRSYIFLKREHEGSIQVHMTPKDLITDVGVLAGEFCNEVIDQRLRTDIARESGKIREIIIAQAFSEGNLLDEEVTEGSGKGTGYLEDPRRVGDSG